MRQVAVVRAGGRVEVVRQDLDPERYHPLEREAALAERLELERFYGLASGTGASS